MTEESRWNVKVVKNYAFVSLAILDDLIDAVNKTAWRGFAPFTVKCTGISIAGGFENSVPFWSVTYSLSIKWDGWRERVLDAGTCERWQIGTNTDGTPIYEFRQIKDKHGEPITEPVPFDGNGKQLQPGQPEFTRCSLPRSRETSTRRFCYEQLPTQ